jgi:hypothetical protein
MLEEREKSAEADKWLALAQTGLALMASDQPTLGGAIGEAGLAGIGAMQQARSQYDKDIMGCLICRQAFSVLVLLVLNQNATLYREQKGLRTSMRRMLLR